MPADALLLYGSTSFGAPQFSADILWRIGFRVPDPVFVLDYGRRVLFVSPLEYGRARQEARVDEVVLLTSAAPAIEQVLSHIARAHVTRLMLPVEFPYAFAKKCEESCTVEVKRGPLYPERTKKTLTEVNEIARAQAAAAKSIEEAREFLKACRIKDGVVFSGDEPLTSEVLRNRISDELYRHGYLGVGAIVASGIQAANPHAEGSGPLMAYAPIVFDVFPTSLTTHYYGDMTRTLFKGEPSPALRRMYETVSRVQEEAIAMVRAGVDGSLIYKRVVERFAEAEYPTEAFPGTAEGFIHGLGHGVGLEIHEEPRIGKRPFALEAGNVITIEPGLYYSKPRPGVPAGGIRIEDIVVVDEEGSQVLSGLPKDFAWAVIG